MQEVAHHLQIEAVKRSGDERDMFARSAYNRYYYSLFLISRDMVGGFNDAWRVAPHKNYPEIIEKIQKRFKAESIRARKNGDSQLTNILEQAIRATADLKKTIELAYGVRVSADYNPNVRVVFVDGGRFELNGVNITSAHEWFPRGEHLIDIIKYAWLQFNG